MGLNAQIARGFGRVVRPLSQHRCQTATPDDDATDVHGSARTRCVPRVRTCGRGRGSPSAGAWRTTDSRERDEGAVCAPSVTSRDQNGPMTVSGVLIAESLLKSSPFEGVTLQVRKVSRADVGDVSAGQPLTWTFIEFGAEDRVLPDLVEALSRSLDPAAGWCRSGVRVPPGARQVDPCDGFEGGGSYVSDWRRPSRKHRSARKTGERSSSPSTIVASAGFRSVKRQSGAKASDVF